MAAKCKMLHITHVYQPSDGQHCKMTNKLQVCEMFTLICRHSSSSLVLSISGSW